MFAEKMAKRKWLIDSIIFSLFSAIMVRFLFKGVYEK